MKANVSHFKVWSVIIFLLLGLAPLNSAVYAVDEAELKGKVEKEMNNKDQQDDQQDLEQKEDQGKSELEQGGEQGEHELKQEGQQGTNNTNQQGNRGVFKKGEQENNYTETEETDE